MTGHSDFDHLLDAREIARRKGARLRSPSYEDERCLPARGPALDAVFAPSPQV